jgi:hypothetical protein
VNHAEALGHLKTMMVSTQKARSNVIESLEGIGDRDPEQLAETTNPWLFGPKSVLPKLVELIPKYEKGAPISGMDFFNLMYVATKFAPEIGVISLNPLPEPDHAWVGEVWWPK